MAGRRAAVSVRSDAQSRAFNTLWQGFGVDAAVLIGLGLTELLATGDPTSGTFWATIAILVLKSILTAIASYLVRLKFPAPSATKEQPAPAPIIHVSTPVDPEAVAKTAYPGSSYAF